MTINIDVPKSQFCMMNVKASTATWCWWSLKIKFLLWSNDVWLLHTGYLYTQFHILNKQAQSWGYKWWYSCLMLQSNIHSQHLHNILWDTILCFICVSDNYQLYHDFYRDHLQLPAQVEDYEDSLRPASGKVPFLCIFLYFQCLNL